VRIVADALIPFAAEAFAAWGEVELLADHEIVPAAVREAECLLLRSVTRANRELLEGSRVRFVGTATAGFDHLDTAWLEQHGVRWAHAPGCNADSVAEWVFTALLHLAARRGLRLEGLRLGVVGVGQVGGRVARRGALLGMEVLRCDPPRARAEGPAAGFLPLHELLPRAQVLTLHVPLLRTGPDRTLGLMDGAALARLPAGALLLNASRGAILDEDALCAALAEGRIAAAALDVWQGEPALAAATLRAVDLASPHVAGHSLDGKVGGTLGLQAALAQATGIAPSFDPRRLLPAPPTPRVELSPGSETWEETLDRALAAVHPLLGDDARLRALAELPAPARAAAFGALRRGYAAHRELPAVELALPGAAAPLLRRARALGFRVLSR